MKLISRHIRDSARGQDCTLRLPGVCNFDPATVVFAHLPVGQKGMGMKTPDLFGVYACSSCHDVIDRRVPGNIDARDMLRALAETQIKLVQAGIIKVAA